MSISNFARETQNAKLLRESIIPELIEAIDIDEESEGGELFEEDEDKLSQEDARLQLKYGLEALWRLLCA
jgi:hypothetical protein